MTLRLSTGLRNALTNGGGFGQIFNRGRIEIYSGTQPTTADAAFTGTLLGTITSSSGAYTKETRISGTITIAGASGSVNTVTVSTLNIIPDGTVPFRVDAATTASDLCDAINRNGLFFATVAGAVVTIQPPYGSGTTYNGAVFATTVTTLTATVGAGTLSGGVNSANGLLFGSAASGTVAKAANQVWSFNGAVAGTAGWFRLYTADSGDSGQVLSGAPWYPRLDGSIAASGADLNLSNITIAVSAPTTVDSFAWTQPAV